MQDQGVGGWRRATAMVNDASKHDANGAKFNDWRLPTKDELNLIYKQKESIGGFIDVYYWSSTEDAHGDAWGQDFGIGNLYYYGKNSNSYVRAVRAF